jgi:release factor glutamine methyltransferase
MSEWQVLKLLEWTKDYFQKYGIPNPRLDAELLLAHTLNLKRIDLYLQHDRPVNATELATFKTYIQRRSKREPLQHILGTQNFYGIQIKVSPAVLIPRPETEVLVETVLKKIPEDSTVNILDLGTGSGAILAALASELPNAVLTGVELTDTAFSIASENLTTWGDRIHLLKGDLFSPLPEDATFDVIVSNPPYISPSEKESLQPEVALFEPAEALFTTDNEGLDFFRRIVKDTPRFLKTNGLLALEMGIGQAAKIKTLLEENGCFNEIEIVKDLNGIERIIIARCEHGKADN